MAPSGETPSIQTSGPVEARADDSTSRGGEETPLLEPQASPQASLHSSSNSSGRSQKQFLRTVVLCTLLTLVADLGGSMLAAPDVRILELSYCREYYRIHDPGVIGPQPFAFVDEHLCKNAEIQGLLAQTRGLLAALSVLPSLLLTLPMGSLADVYGRKLFILLSFTGLILSYFWKWLVCWFHETFSAAWVLASPLFLVIGGGSQVLSALLISTIIDVTPPELRTTVLYYINSAALLTVVVAPLVGKFIMDRNVWLVFVVAVPLVLLSYPIIVMIPESLPQAVTDGLAIEHQSGSDGRKASSQIVSATKDTLGRFVKLSTRLLELIKQDSVATLLAIEFVLTVAVQSNDLILQYASQRLGWSLAQGTYLLSVRAAVALLLLLGILPPLTRILSQRSTHGIFHVDVWILRVSFGLLGCGYFIGGMSSTPESLIIGCIVAALGINAPYTIQGIISHFSTQTNTAELYSILAFVELVGTMIGGPALASAFRAGLHLDKDSIWVGLPYFISAMLCVLLVPLSILIRRPRA